MSRFRRLRPLVLALGAVAALCIPDMAAPAGRAAPSVPHRVAAPLRPGELPAEVLAALKAAKLPTDALVAWVAELGPQGAYAPRLAWRARVPVNAASVMKLYSTGTALELLGPAWTWRTPVLTTGTVDAHGVLHGDVVIQGRGDPTLVIERVWLLLRELQRRGVREVAGDIVLDGSAFGALPAADPGAFDGEALRPYNVQPAALLLNLKAIPLTFVPDAAAGVARVTSDVDLAGVAIDATVPLAAGDCGDWRAALQLDFTDVSHLRLAGRYPLACNEQYWPLAYPEPASYDARLVEAVWHDLGGKLRGRVHGGSTPTGALPLFEFASPPLAAVVRNINKYSNNVMARQLFLTLGLELGPAAAQPLLLDAASDAGSAPQIAASAAAPASLIDAARALVRAQVLQRTACTEPEVVIDNGAGLSRSARTSARCLGAWLQSLWAGPAMPELASSLPVPGLDGTARRPGRAWGAGLGRAHLKTGSLRDAAGLAGYVLGESGRRYALVAIINHPNAGAGKPVLDALVDWTAREGEP